METHSSILSWRISWTEEPAGYSPRGHKSQTRLNDWNHQPWAKFLQCVFSVHPTPDESHWCSSRAPSRKTGPSATWWMLPVWKEWDSLLLIRASLVAQRVKSLLEVWETGVWSLSQEDPLEKEMATHSSILAWRIPWVEELGRLQSTRLQRVRHDWKTSLSLFSAI